MFLYVLKRLIKRRCIMFGKLTDLLKKFIVMGIPGNDCVVYHKGKCIYRKQYGYSDNVNKIEMNGNELYNIYSCSKVITCTAALMLYEKRSLQVGGQTVGLYARIFRNVYKKGKRCKKDNKANNHKGFILYDSRLFV